MNYPHHIVVTSTPLTIGAAGKAVEGTVVTKFTGFCDFQENDRRFDIDAGINSANGSAQTFFPETILPLGFIKGDNATVTLEDGSTVVGVFDRIDFLDDSVLFLRN